jgi:hypothetical protein
VAQPTENVPVAAFGHDPKGVHAVTRQRWLQDNVVDVLARPSTNRVQVATNATAVNLNGATQSTGIGTGAIKPLKYAETQVQARVTLNASANGSFYVFVYRTTGAIPANGAAPNAGDVIVGTDAFGGGTLVAGVFTPATLQFTDTGLNQNLSYKYYLAVSGPNGDVLNLINGSQVIVSEF